MIWKMYHRLMRGGGGAELAQITISIKEITWNIKHEAALSPQHERGVFQWSLSTPDALSHESTAYPVNRGDKSREATLFKCGKRKLAVASLAKMHRKHVTACSMTIN